MTGQAERGREGAIAGWGRFPRRTCRVLQPRSEAAIRAAMAGGPVIARGMARAYGDSALNLRATLDMRGFSRMLSFDEKTGLLVAEAGVVLGDVIATFLPQGWFPPVTPGTRFVTLGGMVAADVHGKNHHCDGGFGGFVAWLDLLDAQGQVLRCSPTSNAALFAATIGGMGLTGIVLRVAFRMRRVESAWIHQRSLVLPDLDAAIAAFEAAATATYSVAWIDCLARGTALGRSILLLGEHAPRAALDPARAATPFTVPPRRRLTVPFDMPAMVLNRPAMRAFNALYYRRGAATAGEALVDWDRYFYPLDAVGGWNRIYGRRGLAQFQCVLPLAQARAGLAALLTATARAGQGSFLAVLKRLGAQDSAFSFPMEGYTLALDFPVNPATLALLARLDRIALDHGGRFYLAKDARMSQATLEESDPRVARFRALRCAIGADARFQSVQSQRLSL